MDKESIIVIVIYALVIFSVALPFILVPENKRVKYRIVEETHKDGSKTYKIKLNNFFGWFGYETITECSSENEAKDYIAVLRYRSKHRKEIEKREKAIRKANPVVGKREIEISKGE